MTRTSTALRRLGVAGLATATIGGFIAIVPMNTAVAGPSGPLTTLTLSPESDSAAVGTCNAFTIRAADAEGDPVAGTFDVLIAETGTATPPPPAAATSGQQAAGDVEFCTPLAEEGPNVDPPADVQSPALTVTTDAEDDNAEYTTVVDGNTAQNDPLTEGVVTFGIISDGYVGPVSVRVYEDIDGDDTYDAGERTDTSTKTFTANDGTDDAAEALDASPETADNFIGEVHEITAVVRNAAGDTLVGVQVTADITDGPHAGITPACGTTDNTGTAECTYTGTAAGTDTIVVFVEQTTGTGPGPDASEPQDSVQKTWATAPTALIVDLTCAGADPNAGDGFEDCANPEGMDTEEFTATVTKPDSGDAGTVRDPAAGVTVEFEITDDNPADGTATLTDDSTLSATSCVTNASGQCSVTLTNNSSDDGDNVEVTATIAGQGADVGACNEPFANSTDQCREDVAEKRWYAQFESDATNIDLEPESGNLPAGNSPLTARVVDQLGNPVPGVDVTFTETGVGNFQNGTNVQSSVTDDAGIATVTLTLPASGSSSVTARITDGAGGTNCGAAEIAETPGVNPGSPAGNCQDTSAYTTGASPSGTPSSSGTPSGTPTTPADCADPRSITITVNVQRITSGNAPTLSGVVRDSGGQPEANCTLTLFAKNYIQTTYSQVQTSAPIVTDANGVYQVVVRPERQTSYALRASNGNQSATLTIFVSARVNLNRPAAGQVLPRNYCFTGDLDPNAPDFRGAAVGLAKVGRDAQGRQTFAVIGQTLTRNDAGATFTVCPRSGVLTDGVYVIFTSARNGLLKGSVSQTVNIV